MGQKIKDKIIEVFYEYPNEKFSVRKLVEKTKIPRATIHKNLIELKKEKLVTKENDAESTLLFKTKKVNFFVEKIISSGLIEELVKKLNPSCIILFGSVRKGESVKESDIDIFVETYSKSKIDLTKFEKKLKHEISLFSETKVTKLQDNLFNNVVNGIKLYGSFKIK